MPLALLALIYISAVKYLELRIARVRYSRGLSDTLSRKRAVIRYSESARGRATRTSPRSVSSPIKNTRFLSKGEKGAESVRRALVPAAIYPFVRTVFENATRSVIGRVHAIKRARGEVPVRSGASRPSRTVGRAHTYRERTTVVLTRPTIKSVPDKWAVYARYDFAARIRIVFTTDRPSVAYHRAASRC